MKKLMVVFMGLIMSLFLFSSCEEGTPRVVDGKPICWTDKYGVKYANIGNQYLFFSSSSSNMGIVEELAIAQELFERDHPGLKYAGVRTTGSYGQVATITYYPRTSDGVGIETDPEVKVGDKVIGKLSEFSSLVPTVAQDPVATE